MKKSIPLILSASLIAYSPTLSASAAHKYRFVTNLSNIRIFYSDSYAPIYGEYTMRAAHQWRTDSRLKFIYPNRVYSSSESDVWCRMYTKANDGVYAVTTFYSGGYSKGVYPDNQNWDHCIIKANHAYTVSLSTFVHKFGHVLGLGHDTNKNSIMCPTGSGRVATVPSYSDYTLVYQKYSPYVG